MSFAAHCDVTPPVTVPETTVLEDGRVIWLTDDGRLQVRQLTALSLAQFRAEVESTGLFGASAEYGLERRPDAPEPPGHGLCIWDFTWTDGEETVEVTSVMWLGEEEESTYYQPAPERRTLHELATQLQDPTAWYGTEGWVQPEAVEFEPQEYLVVATMYPAGLASEGAPDFDEVSWPFDQPPDEFGVEYGFGEPRGRCDVADAAAVQILADELAAAGLPGFDGGSIFGAGAGLPWQARDAAVDIGLWPVLPDGRPTCETPGSD
jgi:hypothetical protein